jgi:DHA2 family metal-tetracycline-proton antiporter-like MFS transporter
MAEASSPNGPSTLRGKAVSPKAAVPVLVFLFIFSLVIDNGFKYASLPMSEDLGIDINVVSLHTTLAGIVTGVGAVAYSALADSVSLKKLFMISIGLIVLGSAIGFIGQGSFIAIIIGRLIQSAGLAASETLYVVYVTKMLPDRDQKTYLGFSAAIFQFSQLVGIVGSGFLAVYVGWTAMFLVAMAPVLTIPLIIKLIPESEQVQKAFDLLGPFYIAVFTTGVILFMQEFNWLWMILAVVGVVLFIIHINRHREPIVKPAFFKNHSYIFMISVVFVGYMIQLAFIFMFPFLLKDLFSFDVAQSSLILVAGYVAATVVGMLSGVIAKVLHSKAAITLGLAVITASLWVPAIWVDASVVLYAASFIFFSVGFVVLYAPLLATALGAIRPENKGVAIGFYNLTINVTLTLGIGLGALLTSRNVSYFGALSTSSSASGQSYATVLYTLGLFSALALILYLIFTKVLERQGYDTKHVIRRNPA